MLILCVPLLLFVLNVCSANKSHSTTEILKELRSKIDEAKIDALLVTSDDEHQNEFVGPSDKRIQFISGFSGSAGTVVVTQNKAVLWTDGRYHVQAANEIDCNWTLMRSGLPGVPKAEEWLTLEFPRGAKIGADSKLVPATIWHTFEKSLRRNSTNYSLVKTNKNLVDAIWKNKPVVRGDAAYVLDLAYSGETWQNKVNETRDALAKLGADSMIVTALDEIAWILNLRGNDIPYTPVVNSYLFLGSSKVVLFLDKNKKPLNFSEIYEQDKQHVVLKNHDAIWGELPLYLEGSKNILVPSTLSYNAGASKEIHDLVPNKQRILLPSPIINLKTKKNPTEIKCMENAHLQDAVALAQFFEYLEENLDNVEMDELSAAKILDQYRANGSSFVMLSFQTISGFGPHGAQPHYIPTPETTSKLVNGSLLVVDSGGNYLGGTTDVTRTISIGNPTPEHKEAYTRVLIGSIDFSSLVFPSSLNLSQIDVLARASLWELGYDYLHGSGHGIGSFLLVHEAPINIMYQSQNSVKVKPGYFTSIEPGFYLEGQFGIRLENIIRVVEKTDLKYKTQGTYLGFKTVTLFPYDINLIDFNLLSSKHILWLQEYYKLIQNQVGEELKKQKKFSTYNWLIKQLSYILDRKTA